MERVRATGKALQRVVELAQAVGPLEELAVVHTHALDKAQRLLAMAEGLVPADSQPVFGQVTPVIGAHIGPGAAGLVCVASE